MCENLHAAQPLLNRAHLVFNFVKHPTYWPPTSKDIPRGELVNTVKKSHHPGV